MYRSAIRSILLACLWAVAAQAAQTGTGQPNRASDPQYILEQIQKRLDAIANYQCTREYPQRRRNAPGAREHLAWDRQGRGRLRELRDNLDATSFIWDGARGMELREQVKPNGTVIHSASIVPDKHSLIDRCDQAWRYLGAVLVKDLTRALKAGTRVSVQPTEEGHLRLEIDTTSDTTWVSVLDPRRGYLPIRSEMLVQGELRRRGRTDFTKVGPGLWFPSVVWSQDAHQLALPPRRVMPRVRFTNIRLNDPDFNRLLAPDLPDGSTVADETRGGRYVVDHRNGLTLAGSGSSVAQPSPTAQVIGSDGDTNSAALGTTYRLAADQALKHIGPPFPAARRQVTLDDSSSQVRISEAVFQNTIYVLQCDDGPTPEASYIGAGFLTLSEVLQYVCGLKITEYSGAKELLDLRLKGDWIVRRTASRDERVRALEPIVYEQTAQRITFEKQRVDTPVIRATGIFRYQPLFGTAGQPNIHLFTETPDGYEGGGSGHLSQFLKHLANRVQRPVVDETLSSDLELSWSDYRSSEMTFSTGLRERYNRGLVQLLENVSKQTGLTFTQERRKIDEWHVTLRPQP